MTMVTKYWPSTGCDQSNGLQEAAAVLARGGVVAFPTETVYGLGGDARNTSAVEQIFKAKGRPSDNPLIVHLADVSEVSAIADRISELEKKLMSAFWPGPLTLVLPVREGAVSPLVTAGLDTVAVRVPAHELARQLIAASGCPLAAPSANRSGRPSPTEAGHVQVDLDGRIDGILDGGATGVGLESTVVRVLGDQIHILRPGGVTAEQLQAAVGATVQVVDEPSHSAATQIAQEQAPRSPGMKYAHYAPKGELMIVSGLFDRIPVVIQARIHEAKRGGDRIKVGVLSCTEHTELYQADVVIDLGSHIQPEQAAKLLYRALRECDDHQLTLIFAEGYPEQGIGTALMNRLRKAAAGRELQA
ncbi:MAG: L-threonylcarbamoyladenylate synthase [Candidatus Cohnella colombiensis]|uniref:Threonylcarbamoyl-AMP synthase n=1 Tax=Candidatus Cohnella colombiensis TaxID=3121368 RepID=A0AA95EV57_9BACL|nr:MAG: L-threonylcarbamoyladenylate synthase [Cohnella sp.]